MKSFPRLDIWSLIFVFCVITLKAFAVKQYNSSHSAFGDAYDAPKCYVVNAKILNVRKSPSLYKGKKKAIRKDNIAFALVKGDTVFVSVFMQITKADGIEWISFEHEGDIYYANKKTLSEIDNLHYVQHAPLTEGITSQRILRWSQDNAQWLLLIISIIVFLLSFAVNKPDKDCIIGEKRDDTGMRPIFIYSLKPYKFFAGISIRLLVSIVSSFIIFLIVATIVLGLLEVIKFILWIFSVNNSFVEAGLAFFDTVNIWDFGCDLVKRYWASSFVISTIPLILFVLSALVVFVIAWCLRGFEAFTTYRYNVNHKCPWCQRPSEPAQYFDNRGNALPCTLRPGIYGLLHITHPETGLQLPTLIANGRDKLVRKCPNCGHFINFKEGTEKHIGFIGMPASGKTSLLCCLIGTMMKRKSGMRITNTLNGNIKEIENEIKFVKKNGFLDTNHFPPKTGVEMRASIQCTYPRKNERIPFNLYFNDVAGELYTAGGNDKKMLLFTQNVEIIMFIIDPWTMTLNEHKISGRVRKWLKNDEVELMRNEANEEVLNAFDSLINALDSCRRDLSKIKFNFIFVKSDTGYLDGVDYHKESALKQFMKEDLKLGHLIFAADSRFMSVSYVATSVFCKDGNGITDLCNLLIKQLELE